MMKRRIVQPKRKVSASELKKDLKRDSNITKRTSTDSVQRYIPECRETEKSNERQGIKFHKKSRKYPTSFLRKVAFLNEKFMSAFMESYNTNRLIDFTPTMKDYIRYISNLYDDIRSHDENNKTTAAHDINSVRPTSNPIIPASVKKLPETIEPSIKSADSNKRNSLPSNTLREESTVLTLIPSGTLFSQVAPSKEMTSNFGFTSSGEKNENKYAPFKFAQTAVSGAVNPFTVISTPSLLNFTNKNPFFSLTNTNKEPTPCVISSSQSDDDSSDSDSEKNRNPSAISNNLLDEKDAIFSCECKLYALIFNKWTVCGNGVVNVKFAATHETASISQRVNQSTESFHIIIRGTYGSVLLNCYLSASQPTTLVEDGVIFVVPVCPILQCMKDLKLEEQVTMMTYLLKFKNGKERDEFRQNCGL